MSRTFIFSLLAFFMLSTPLVAQEDVAPATTASTAGQTGVDPLPGETVRHG